MTLKERYAGVIAWFEEHMPVAESELAYGSPYELLVAVILSAQCTDKRVNMTTPALFEAFPTPQAMAAATPEQIYPYIKSISYPNNKARKTNLKKMAELLVYLEEHHISTIEELNEHVKGKKAELGILGQVNRRKKADIAGFKENLRYLNWYEEGIPIIGKIEKRKFNKAKERIKAENGDTLRRYHIAKRILTERELLGKMDKTTLQQKISSLNI